MIDIKKKNLEYYFFIFTLYLLVFQDWIQKYIWIIKWFDELLALAIIPLIIINIKKLRYIKKYDFIVMTCLSFTLVLGLISNIRYRYQPLGVVLSDILLVFKFFSVYYMFSLINEKKQIYKNSDSICMHIKFIIFIIFILTIINLCFNIFPSVYSRYNMTSNQLFYGHPSTLAAIGVFLLGAVVTFEKKINKKYIIMTVFIITSTLRIKAIGFCCLFILLYLYVSKTNKRITISKMGLFAIIAILIAYNQINYYFLKNADSARNVLLITSIKIARDYFPLGAGFGTFGSYMAAKNYSILYYKYGINNVFGLTKDGEFLCDSFWPMILGQFGIFGMILYILCILIIFKKIQANYKSTEKNIYIAKIAMLMYLVIASTAETAFVHPMAIPLAIIIGL